MILIPAIDIKDGCCVRLVRGDLSDPTVYSSDPVSQARRWADLGASRLHVVDLDGAKAGEPVHAEAIADIVRACPELAVQVGGGIRSVGAALAYLEAGASFVIVGTRAAREPEFIAELASRSPERVIGAIDVLDGKVAVGAWSESAEVDPLDLALKFQQGGAAAIVYTDVSRDGTLAGANVRDTADFARELDLPVIVSGGIKGLDDVREVLSHLNSGIQGAIAGKSLYEGTLDFALAQQEIRRHVAAS